MSDAVLVFVTAPSPEVARQMAKALVEERLIACANLLPAVQSIYRWEGKVHEESETLLFIKTRRALFEKLRARVVALHPYECPEVISVDIDAGHPPYLSWLAANVSEG